MSNIAVIEPRANASPLTRPSSIMPSSLDEVARLSKMVVDSGLAPKGLETPQKVGIAILHGLELGLPPMTALQRIAVVNGRPTIYGDAAMGLVRASGLLEYAKEDVTGQNDARVAVCEVRRRGEPAPVIRRFSVTEARKAGLWGKAGPWQQYPDRMLQMRARAFALRDVFADVLGGLYLREEFEDDTAPQARNHHSAPAVIPTVEIPDPAQAAAAPNDIPNPSGAPNGLLAKFKAALACAVADRDLDALERAWSELVEPRAARLSRDEYETLRGLYAKAEAAFEPAPTQAAIEGTDP